MGRVYFPRRVEHGSGRLIKAFNTIHAAHLRDEARTGLPFSKRYAIFVAGDDATAKQTVMQLIESIGFAPVDTGSLAHSTVQEPGTPIYGNRMNGEAGLRAVAST